MAIHRSLRCIRVPERSCRRRFSSFVCFNSRWDNEMLSIRMWGCFCSILGFFLISTPLPLKNSNRRIRLWSDKWRRCADDDSSKPMTHGLANRNNFAKQGVDEVRFTFFIRHSSLLLRTSWSWVKSIGWDTFLKWISPLPFKEAYGTIFLVIHLSLHFLTSFIIKRQWKKRTNIS